MMKSVVILLATICFLILPASSYSLEYEYDLVDCNDEFKPHAHYQFISNRGYCLDFKTDRITLVNLSNRLIDHASSSHTVSTITPEHYIISSGKFAVYNVQNLVVSKEQNDVVVIRERRSNVEALPRIAPLAVWVPSAIGGGVLGAMGAVYNNPNAGTREIGIGIFVGALSGGLTPIMGGGVFGFVAAGSLGFSAGGGCSVCHSTHYNNHAD
ncbi:hypothetical protein [Vibrio sp. SCSIO 43137]|uniref:hypothetical protein n=1 Tax=Vibrio sp. SCSIO 43137 TaxID=3021011 RepID=UPI0023070618|nr:hypothetical protein [Vibrio sp. SCSIO 43137]WCE28823.1 hypothetical protein PK654_10680 [Vibrio sp. SCSIO 43137]